MSRNNTVFVLAAEQDAQTLAPILEAMRARGLKIAPTGTKPGKGQLVLAALTEHFYADAEKTRTLLELVSAGAEMLPLQLDETPIPQELKNALYARNIIPAAGRDPRQLAERAASAVPAGKSRLPLILTAAALVIAVAAGVWMWKSGSDAEPGEDDAVDVINQTIPDEPVVYAGGITQEDLDKVHTLTIVGEEVRILMIADARSGKALSEEDFSYTSWDEQRGTVWYSKEDGHEYSLTSYDLSFLPLLTNLTDLSLQLVDADIPDLSGLAKLGGVVIQDCTISDISFLDGAHIRSAAIYRCPITDYAPLTGCDHLTKVMIDASAAAADFSEFSPPLLQELDLWGGGRKCDLSGLAGCRKLRNANLYDFDNEDISFLAGKTALTSLYLGNFHRLRDVTALGSLTSLETLILDWCDQLTDLSPVAGCVRLREFRSSEARRVTDLSCLTDLPKLSTVGVYGSDLRNVDFLEGMADNSIWLSVLLGGDVRDWSGLRFIKKYDELNLALNTKYDPQGSYAAVAPYLEGAVVQRLFLNNCSNVDLSALPEVNRYLELNDIDLRDLRGIGAFRIQELKLQNMDMLSSLEGLRNLPGFDTGSSNNLRIYNCPRLTDFSALEDMNLNELDIAGAFVLPSMENIRFNSLRLQSIAELTDLSLLDCKSDGWNYKELDFTGTEDLQNLTALRRFQGDTLIVPPHLLEQAEDLQKEGAVHYVRVAYPDQGWNPDDIEVKLLDLEELNTLPKALLRRVREVTVAGDQVIDRDQCWIWDDWDHSVKGKPGVMLVDPATEKKTPVKMGSIQDMSVFADLTGLRSLDLNALPLRSLDGIQVLSELRCVQVRACRNITDFSPLFALQQLEELRLRSASLDSIQGVQNFWALRTLDICSSDVTDISALTQCDFSRAYEDGGFALEIGGTRIDDLSPLGSIRLYSLLDVNGYETRRWLGEVENSQIRKIYCQMDSDLDLADFVREHPEIEELHIGGSRNVTDLTPVLELENLRYLKITGDMPKAEASLKGTDYGFELYVDR